MPIKGGNSVANLQKVTHYNPNIDFVYENVYTKFCLILSIRSQDIERKSNYSGMTENDRMTGWIQYGFIFSKRGYNQLQ